MIQALQILNAIKRQIILEEGYELDPVYITTTALQIAPNGCVFYLFEPFGADAVITKAWDAAGNVITALTGSKFTDGFPVAISVMAIIFEDQGATKFIQAFLKNFQKDTVFINLVAPVVSGDDTEGGSISTTDGTYCLTPTTVAYAWYLDDVLVTGETTNTIDPTEPGDYYCIVTATRQQSGSIATVSTQSNTFTVNPA